jgi:N-acetyl-anhydromuramyl-L-alanine amidase AmpD
MVAQLRPTRLDVTDRFPMLGFTIRTDNPPRAAEVVLASDPALFTRREGRTPSTFYSSREHGLLTVPRGEAVYVVPPEVLARFVAADRLWFGLATASTPAANDWKVDVLPTPSSPYISLSGLTDRSLRRVRVYPSARGGAGYGNSAQSVLDWAGDRAAPGMIPAGGAAPPAATPVQGGPSAPPQPAPQEVPYDDGFGPLPPLQAGGAPAAADPAGATASAPAAQAYGRGMEVDPEAMGIDGPAFSPDQGAPATAAGTLSLSAADYPGTSRTAPSPAFNPGRAGQAIDRIVIHITDAPTTSSTVNHFTRADANSSAHYLVGQDGEVIQFVAEADTAWHARGVNRRSIGIEHVAVKQGGATYGSTTFPYKPPTDTQYAASAALVADICRRRGLAPDRSTIIGHREADAKTSHTSCPDGAWDWTVFMDQVARCFAAGAAGQALGAREPKLRAIALDAGSITISPTQQPVAPPPVETVSQLRSIAIQAMLAANPAMTPMVLMARAAAEAAGVSVGIGPSVSAGLLGGGGLGCGLIFAPGNVMGVYGQFEVSAGWIASIGANLQITVVRGGIDAFRGVTYAAGISGGEGLTGGAAALFNDQREFQGVTLQVGIGAGLSPVDVFTSVQHAIAGQLGYAMAALDPATASALSAGETVEIKYRAFIPSPLIKGPASDYDPGRIGLPGLIGGEDFGGDGRGFSYDSGTSRAEIVATLTLGSDGSISNLRTVRRHWGESTAYDSTYTYHVQGKPDWWMDKHAGHTPSRRSTLAASDDNLRIYQGAGTTSRSILAMTSQSAVVTVEMAGALPLVWPTPDIDADVSIYLKPASGGIQVMVVGDHDGFPAHELYVNGRSIYTYDPVAAGKGPGSLVAPTDQEISTSWIFVPSRGGAAAQGLGQAHGAASRALDADDWSINWDDVDQIAQPTDMGCWATAAAMLVGWRDRQSVDPTLIARFSGCEPSLTDGLSPAAKRRFADSVGLIVHPNA